MGEEVEFVVEASLNSLPDMRDADIGDEEDGVLGHLHLSLIHI